MRITCQPGYMAGTARSVWVPDLKTQERRDLFHIHRKAVKRTTQLRNRLQSYLSASLDTS